MVKRCGAVPKGRRQATSREPHGKRIGTPCRESCYSLFSRLWKGKGRRGKRRERGKEKKGGSKKRGEATSSGEREKREKEDPLASASLTGHCPDFTRAVSETVNLLTAS